MNVESVLEANPLFTEGHEFAMGSSPVNMYTGRAGTGLPSIYVAPYFNCQHTACLQECNIIICSFHVLYRIITKFWDDCHEVQRLGSTDSVS
jgi:hypothetical protein